MNNNIENFQGLHLFHSATSNCSMRVRMILEEKKLLCESHLLDATKREHLTEEYLKINPKGLVPTLIHNGFIITESIESLIYIDKNFDAGSLSHKNSDDIKESYKLMSMANDMQIDIKTYLYGTIDHLKILKKSKEELELYKSIKTIDSSVIKFHEKNSSKIGLTDEDVSEAYNALDKCFTQIDRSLKGKEWIVGDKFSIVDIAWFPQVVLLEKANYPFAKYHNLQKWRNAIADRYSFKNDIFTIRSKTK